jgi:hypothetical protein
MGQQQERKETAAVTDHEGDWEIEEAKVSQPVDAVVSVRFPRDLADQLFAEARRRGVKTSAVVREAVETLLREGIGKTATVDVTISSAEAPVTLYTGRGSHVRTQSAPATVVLDET